MLIEVCAVWTMVRAWYSTRAIRGEEGSVVEKVILTAIFAALAIAVGAIIVREDHGQGELAESQLKARPAWSRADVSHPPKGRVERDERGSVAEAVIVIPVAMLILLMAVQACLWARASTIVHVAAARGDEAACIESGTESAGIQRATSILAGGTTVSNPSVTAAAVDPGEIAVRVQGTAISIVPWLRLNVSAEQVGTKQVFRVYR